MNPARDEAGFVLQLARPLPEADSPPAANETWAWLIELQDGTICVPFTGTNPLIHGEMAHYGCGESVLLLGALASKGQAWSAKKALVTYGKSGVSVKSQVKVILKRVWQ
jgi:hypothetical protein